MATSSESSTIPENKIPENKIPDDILQGLLETTASHFEIPVSQLKRIIGTSHTWNDIKNAIKRWNNSLTFDIRANLWTDHNVKSSCQLYGITVPQYMALLREHGGWDRFRERASELRAQNLKELEEKKLSINNKLDELVGH
jgi:hypothetical protein